MKPYGKRGYRRKFKLERIHSRRDGSLAFGVVFKQISVGDHLNERGDGKHTRKLRRKKPHHRATIRGMKKAERQTHRYATYTYPTGIYQDPYWHQTQAWREKKRLEALPANNPALRRPDGKTLVQHLIELSQAAASRPPVVRSAVINGKRYTVLDSRDGLKLLKVEDVKETGT